ncbi:hypothetical protein M3D71_010100 [Micrococcus luteus]|uniref:tyrosine-type recombinase/integrase n=1 Tax=Micrococcus TaxID=1269 RepID=UPI00098F5B58|nr:MULTISPECIES: hypothetical protein [Micrococcus]MCV7456625.1 hypothetical protein [Micrococcus luteus]MCV7512475.1 hypothetical protein [Micrococcus luteus]MCV7521175.1 hypothetical protein [Micrococcus luteus]MCV7556758.1 hypothetical protein [Micrococcus luteus]QAV29305.1 hypothetical protein MT1254_08285 [Micrococcus luteus]
MANTRAPNSKLAPGEHSIDRVKPTKQADGTYVLRWRVCLPDGTVKPGRSQGPTVAEVRRRAREKVGDLLATSADGSWKPSSSIVDYIDKVSIPAVDAARLAEASRRRYRVALNQWKTVLGSKTIAQTARVRTLEAALKRIAEEHGSESARHCKTVWGKYIAQQLVRDEVLSGNPLAGMSVDLSSSKPARPRAERTLTREELGAAIDWLLSLDPAAGVEKPARGRWSREDAVAKRRNVIDLALLQAASGLRVQEANALTWNVFDRSADVRRTKTGKGRRVPLLFPDVVDHLAERRSLGGAYVIGAPTDPDKQWDRDACRKACATFYPEIGAAIDCEVFEHGRTHLWRGTLNSLLVAVPVEVRAAFLGHDEDTNRRYYTDVTDPAPMVEAAKALR